MKHTPTFCQWPGGVALDYLNPTGARVDFAWIARRLAAARRFNSDPHALTVAQHSLLVARAMIADGHSQTICLAALLHDAHEAFTGDISAPLRNAIRTLAGLDPVSAITHSLDVLIFTAAGIGGLASDGAVELIIRDYDLRARANEVRDCLGDNPANFPGCNRPPLDRIDASLFASDGDGGASAFTTLFHRLAA